MTPLQGLRVVEWGEMISSAYCGLQLAEFGARVDKVEPPGGDALRRYGPFPADEADPECSGLFIHLNSAKRSFVTDPQTPAGREVLQALIARADVFVTNYPLALCTRLGLDAASLRARFPRLLYASLSVFGNSGPLADAPAQTLDAYAVSGCAWVIGEQQREPLIVPLLQADYQAGAHAAAAILMALLARRRNPDAQAAQEGETIAVASADVLAAAVGTNAQIYLFHGTQRWERAGRRAFGSGGPYPYTILPCKDGTVCLIGRARQEWARLVDAMGTPEWTQLPRYQDLQAMGRDYPDEVDALVMPWLARHTRAELLKLAESFGFPLAPLRTMSEVAASPQFAHRGFFRDIPHFALRHVRVPGVPWQFSGHADPTPSPAPTLGEHTVSILDELEIPQR
jgi:hypothetical protein